MRSQPSPITTSASVPRHDTLDEATDSKKPSNFETVKLAEPDDRFTMLSAEVLLANKLETREWVPVHQIASFAQELIGARAQIRGGHDPEVYCYRAKGGWIPELRPMDAAKGVEQQMEGLRKRLEAVFDNPENTSGISSRRGPREVAMFRAAYGQLVGERMDPRTKHLLPELNVVGEGDDQYAQLYHVLRTAEERPEVTPADINTRKLTFESVPTDVVSKAVFDPVHSDQWSVQTVRYQSLSSDIWQKQYGDGPITGSVATQREDGIYVLAFDEHVNRFVTDLENMGFPNVDRNMVIEMMKEHLLQDKDWIPNADNEFGNRYYLRAKGKSIKFSPALSGPFKELTLAGTPVGDFKVAKDEKVRVKLMGERQVVKANANRKAETAYEGPVSQLVTSNKEQIDADKPLYHEALFMWTDLKKNGSPKSYDEVTKLQEGASANVAVVMVNESGEVTVKTPDPKECGVLPGITVKLALQLAEHNGWKAEYGVVSKEDLENAAEVFMTGTAMGIREVGLVDGDESPVYESSTKGVGQFTQALIDGYEQILAGTHSDDKLNGKMKKVVSFEPKNGVK